MKIRILLMALALILLTGAQALAQAGIVGWVEVAGSCSIDSTSAAHKISFGTVMFSGTASGNIYINCPVDTIMRIAPTDVNSWGLIFENNNGFVGGVNECTVSATFVQVPHSNPLLHFLVSAFTTAGKSYTGFTTADPFGTGPTLDFDHNSYFVSITLNRRSGATCNPQVWTAFAEDVIL